MYMKRELSAPDVGVGLVNKKIRFVSLPPTAPQLVAHVKLEDVAGENACQS